jgi:hypothetical protein
MQSTRELQLQTENELGAREFKMAPSYIESRGVIIGEDI